MQRNNIQIFYNEIDCSYHCVSPKGVLIQRCNTEEEAIRWCQRNLKFVSRNRYGGKAHFARHPKFIAYFDPKTNFVPPRDKSLVEKPIVGMTSVYYRELLAEDVLGAIREIRALELENIYLTDIYQKGERVTKDGYVEYKAILRQRSHGFYPIEEDNVLDDFVYYNQSLKDYTRRSQEETVSFARRPKKPDMLQWIEDRIDLTGCD